MSKEIERKFLVRGSGYRLPGVRAVNIEQGYLNVDPERTVRVRIADADAFLTVKSKTRGIERGEWEYAVPRADALEMLELCTRRISKTRYIVPAAKGLKWEVDEFHGRLEGLVLAEIELPDSGFEVELPEFIGREVSGDPAYYNSNLAS